MPTIDLNQRNPTDFPSPPSFKEDSEGNPDFDKNERKAVQNSVQAWAITNTLIDSAKDRVDLVATIQREIDAIEPPIDPCALKETAKDYKSNISTGFLQTIIQKIAPKFVLRVKAASSLTAARLEGSTEDAVGKSEHFQRVITDAIRMWPGWNNALNSISFETSQYGYNFPVWLDQDDWRPEIMRQDKCFIPNGTKQNESPTFFVVRRDLMVHELMEMVEDFKDKEEAEDAGWDLDLVLRALENAHPRDVQEEDPEIQFREFEDMRREITRGTSFEKEANLIPVRELFALEADGKSVSHWILGKDSEQAFFHRDEAFDSMGELIMDWCFQHGNGSVHGSFGVGQMIYDLAHNIELTRNSSIDGLRNREKFIITVDEERDLTKAKLLVSDEAIYLAGATFTGNIGSLPDNVEASITLDSFFSGIAQEKVGAFLPEAPVQGADETATKAQINALREDETRQAIMDFFLTNLARMIFIIQKKLMDKNSTDEVAKAARKRVLEKLSKEEIEELINKSPITTTIDFTEAKNQQMIAQLETLRGDPDFNQRQVKKEIANLRFGAEMTDRLLISEVDQTIEIEATNLQIFELDAMEKGIGIAVSPRDNDLVHISVLRSVDEQGELNSPVLPMIQDGNFAGAAATIDHYEAHVQQAGEKGVLKEQVNQERQLIANLRQSLEAAEEEAAALEAGEGAPPPQQQ